MRKSARANVTPIRQMTQFTCVSTSTCMALNALGVKCSEEQVNEVIGAKPMQGSRWEEVLACAQYFGCRATLTTPATLTQVKEWTDQGKPVLIAWNPEGRDWSHASLIFDVTGERGNYIVHIADPNIPNPDKTVREVEEDEFYSKWFEKWPNYLVRRPALMIDREITPEGRQVMASVSSESAVRNIISSIRHLGFLIVKDQWSTTQKNIVYKISAHGLANLTLEFDLSGETPLALLFEGTDLVRTVKGVSKFPEIIRHLPSRTHKMASVLPLVQSEMGISNQEALDALSSVPDTLPRRERAVQIAERLDYVKPRGMFSVVDLVVRDLDKIESFTKGAGRKKKET